MRRRPAVRIVFRPLLRRHRGIVTFAQVIVRKGKPERGERVISIDPRVREPARYLLHELIHLERPAASETWVKAETARRWARASWREKAELLRMLGAARMEGAA